jgi:hypothetical protein
MCSVRTIRSSAQDGDWHFVGELSTQRSHTLNYGRFLCGGVTLGSSISYPDLFLYTIAMLTVSYNAFPTLSYTTLEMAPRVLLSSKKPATSVPTEESSTVCRLISERVVGVYEHIYRIHASPKGIAQWKIPYTTLCWIFWISSQCRPDECIFRSGNPGGSGFWVKGNRWVTEGTKRVSLRATGSRGGRILTQQGGFQVSRQGEQGEQGADHVHKLNFI